MIIKKFNTAYMPEADRVLLKISTETSKKSSDQYQFILTRRITKKLIQLLSKKNAAEKKSEGSDRP
jgi:phage antirepressor YoqD-like protein